MDSTTQLLIRACKRDNPLPRLKRVYKRMYLGVDLTEEQTYTFLCHVLAPIVDKYCPMDVCEILRELESENTYSQGELTEKNKMFNILRRKITFTKGDKFEGLTQPLWWRIKFGGNDTYYKKKAL
tara:strand:- start:445 stop:819 length:375 start_codon:yes stop_codon:yes gene_type:complete